MADRPTLLPEWASSDITQTVDGFDYPNKDEPSQGLKNKQGRTLTVLQEVLRLNEDVEFQAHMGPLASHILDDAAWLITNTQMTIFIKQSKCGANPKDRRS